MRRKTWAIARRAAMRMRSQGLNALLRSILPAFNLANSFQKPDFARFDQRGSTIALARSASYVFIPIFFLIDLKIFSKQKQYAVY